VVSRRAVWFVADELERQCSDVYPEAVRLRLAEVAVARFVGHGPWRDRAVLALMWLQDIGHIGGYWPWQSPGRGAGGAGIGS
jgi:hypothetical protein